MMKSKKQIREHFAESGARNSMILNALVPEDKNFNNKHPELRKNTEVFLLNIRLYEFENFKRGAAQPFPFKKIRMGKIAYNNLGEIVKGFVPIFGIIK